MIQGQRKKSPLLHIPDVRKMSPYTTMLYFAMGASGFLFMVMIVLYTAQRFRHNNISLDIEIPKAFIISTVILLFSSFCLVKAKSYFQKDQVKLSARWLAATLLLGTGFAALQVIGWIEFFNSGFGLPTANVASSYVYIITGIHFMHVFAALVFLSLVLIPAYRKSLNVVDELIMVTNPFEKQKMELLARFWHYVDFLWLFLFFYFLLTF